MLIKQVGTWIIISSITLACYAQNQLPTKYAALIDTATARQHLSILASDAFEGRETGTEGAEKAARYIASQFEKLGLKPPVRNSYFQPVKLATNKLVIDHFSIGNKKLITDKDFLIINPGSKQVIQEDEILFIGYGEKNEKHYAVPKSSSIRGKVILLFTGPDTSPQSTVSPSSNKRIQQILNLKPKLVLVVSANADTVLTAVQGTKQTEKIQLKEDLRPAGITNSTKATVVYTSRLAADNILKSAGYTLQALNAKMKASRKPVNIQLNTTVNVSFGVQPVDVKAQNVLGFLEGTDLKDELLIITAHYDHIGINADGQINNGADDDGSGVTGVLETAAAFTKAKQNGHGPRRSILFMTVTGEEKGLLGSDYYTRYPVFPLAKTIANLNIDMIGRIDPKHFLKPNYVYLVGSDKLSSELHKISEQANQTYTKLDLDYKYNDPNDPEKIYYRSDHYNFAKHNIPVIFYFNGVHEDYHAPGDTVDKIDFSLLTKRAKLVFYTAWKLANSEHRPIVDSNKK